MLRLEQVCAGYDRVAVLENIELELVSGSITALLGNNGAGKTTLLKSIMGLTPAVSGRIVFKNADLKGHATENIVRQGIGYVPEGREIFGELTVWENLQMGAYTRGDKAEIRQDLDRIWQWFPILETRAKQMAGTLSGGEQQMLAMGCALMGRPDLLLLDEPSLGLSPRLACEVFQIIEKINQEGVTILLVEQNAARALDAAVYGYILEQGRIAIRGKSEDLKTDPTVKQLFLGGSQGTKNPFGDL